jgi:hypothetical protein
MFVAADWELNENSSQDEYKDRTEKVLNIQNEALNLLKINNPE